ncbi:hypothetical protein ACSKE1_002798 [Enterobacter hormaechei]
MRAGDKSRILPFRKLAFRGGGIEQRAQRGVSFHTITGPINAGFFCHFPAIFLFFSAARIRCMSLHSFFTSGFASQRQHWRGSGLLMRLH